MKILKEKYPKGSFKGQISDGKYIEGYLYENLKLLAKSIVNDMTFLGFIFSSTLEVGTGKSVFATQIGEAWAEIMKVMHNIDVPFSINNVVWRPKELIEKSFKVPKYSYILLDEWEDNHYWSELGMTLRQFFRKCRQLNLFIMCIIPNWFELPKGYAISRSIFAIDVRFEDGFKRGFFRFYDFASKRKLYIKGKKEHNYNVARSSFAGKFTDGYGVPRQEYLDAKKQDLVKYEGEDEEGGSNSLKVLRREQNKHFKKCGIDFKERVKLLNVTSKTVRRYDVDDVLDKATGQTPKDYNNNNTNVSEVKVGVVAQGGEEK